MSPADFDPLDDVEWQTKMVLRLVSNPGLSDEQRAAVERDFSMEDGKRAIEVRLSMAYYFVMRMNLDLADLPAAREQIRLDNLDEVRAALDAAR